MTLSRTTEFSAIFQTALLLILALALGLTAPLISAQKESAPARKDDSVYAELAKAPKKAVARRNPMEHDPEAVAAGEKLFGLHCAQRHGQTAEGGRQTPSFPAHQARQAAPCAPFCIPPN